MNSLNYFIVMCAVIFLPGALFGAFWWYIMKRGRGSTWLLATSSAVFMSLLFIILSLAAKEKWILIIGVGFSILSGIVQYLYLRTSPIGNALIGKNQVMQDNWAALSDEQRNTRRQSSKIMLRDIFLVGLLQIAPVIIGTAIILLSKERSAFTLSLGAFVFGFSGILKIVLRPKNVPSELYLSRSRIVGNILITAFAWTVSIYILIQGLRAP